MYSSLLLAAGSRNFCFFRNSVKYNMNSGSMYTGTNLICFVLIVIQDFPLCPKARIQHFRVCSYVLGSTDGELCEIMGTLQHRLFFRAAQLQSSISGISVFMHNVRSRGMCTSTLIFCFAGNGCSFNESENLVFSLKIPLLK